MAIGGGGEAGDLEPLFGADAAAARVDESVAPGVEEREGGALRPLGCRARRRGLGERDPVRGRLDLVGREARRELESERVAVGAAAFGARGGGRAGGAGGGGEGPRRRRRGGVVAHG